MTFAENDAESKRTKDDLSFIHSTLDDSRLSPSEFRVYCHVNRVAGRNGVCTQALKTIATHCGYCPEIVRAALRVLVARRFLRLNEVRGHGNEYRLAIPSEWVLLETPLGKNSRGKKSEGTPRKKSEDHPLEKLPPKGIPSEGIPIKGERPLINLKEWQLNRDLDDVEKRIESEKEKDKPDKELLNAWRNQRRTIKDEIRHRGRISPPNQDKDSPIKRGFNPRLIGQDPEEKRKSVAAALAASGE